MPRIVLDTDVMVAALRSDRGAARQLLLSGLDRRLLLLGSVALFIEYEAVLTRAEHLVASGLTDQDVNEILDALSTVIMPVQFHFRWRPMLRDPGDEMVLETAVNGAAEFIVTFNVRHFAAAREFGIRVVRPGEAWKELGYEKK